MDGVIVNAPNIAVEPAGAQLPGAYGISVSRRRLIELNLPARPKVMCQSPLPSMQHSSRPPVASKASRVKPQAPPTAPGEPSLELHIFLLLSQFQPKLDSSRCG